ncbi:MAG: SGNH/GDSL hydrolase family protein [Mycobacteriales bacterium]
MSAPAGPQAPHPPLPGSRPSTGAPRQPNGRVPTGKAPTQDLADRETTDRDTTDRDTTDRDTTDPYCLSAGAADELLADAPWRRFAVLGDGVVDGRGDSTPGYRDIGWADRVAGALARRRGTPADFAYCNLAERERRTAEIRTGQLARALAFRPDLALVVAGSNDVLRRDFERCDDVLADYDAIVTALQAAGADVVTATIFDVTRSPRVPDDRKAPLHRRLDHLAGRIRLVARARRTLHLDLAGHPAEREPDVYGRDIRFATRRGQAIGAAALVRRLGRHLGTTAG